eukprot:7989838-Prorocentrum_lima.AAC.1
MDRCPASWIDALAAPTWSHTVEYVAMRWEQGLRQKEAARSAVPLPVDWALPVGVPGPMAE